MTQNQKVDFYAAVYKCALGNSQQYSETLDSLMSVGKVSGDVIEIWNDAFTQARDDIAWEERRLQELALIKAKRYFKRKREEPFVKDLVECLK